MEEKGNLTGYSWWGKPPGNPSEEPGLLDHQLIAQAQRGAPEAMSALYMRYRRRILNYLYRLTANRSRAEDLTQETFLRVVRYLPSYKPTGSVAGWIYRIARNTALNDLRGNKGIKEVSLDEPEGYPEQEEDGPQRQEKIADTAPGPQEQAGQAEMAEAIQKAMMQMDPIFREVLVLCDVQGYAYKEAAEMLHLSINTVASRLARGRAKLAELLGYLKDQR